MKISSSQHASAYRSPDHAWPSPAMSARLAPSPPAALVQQPDELPLHQVQVELLAPRQPVLDPQPQAR